MGDRFSCPRHPRETTYTACAVCLSAEERAAIAEGRRLERERIVALIVKLDEENEYNAMPLTYAIEAIEAGEHEEESNK